MRVLDLFCGAGGFSKGFQNAGFEVTGVDVSEIAKRTFEMNQLGSFIKADLSDEVIVGAYDAIVGGPPCKPWAVVNLTKRREIHGDYNLVDSFFNHVVKNKPRIFLMENVPSLMSDSKFKGWMGKLARIGYVVDKQIVRYSDFGAATHRRRMIVAGILESEELGSNSNSKFFSELAKLRKPRHTVRDRIWHLRDQDAGAVPDHEWPALNTISKYKAYYATGKYGWYILDWDNPAPSFGNVMKTYILHPDSNNGGPKRVISVREAALIMGLGRTFRFPDDCGLGKRYQMVADLVSPAFSHAAARGVAKILKNGEAE